MMLLALASIYFIVGALPKEPPKPHEGCDFEKDDRVVILNNSDGIIKYVRGDRHFVTYVDADGFIINYNYFTHDALKHEEEYYGE